METTKEILALEVNEPKGPFKVGIYEPWTQIVSINLYGRIYLGPENDEGTEEGENSDRKEENQ